MAYDLTWLTASVKSWTRRADLAAQIPDFLMFAEERMSADLEARGQQSIVTIPTVAGTASVPLDPSIIEIRSVRVPSYQPLDYLADDAFNSRYNVGETGVPRNYKVVGDLLYLGPIPDGVYQLKVSAKLTLPSLTTATGGTNWLIKRNPSLYLAAVMFEAMVNLRDDAGQAVWNGKYQIALAAANSTQNTPGDLVVRSDTYTP